ncbi:MAG: hypothetical protein EAZ20_00395, partial [Bacteroidetes bacterium]
IEKETGLDEFKAYLNGQYLPLDYDSKTNILSFEKEISTQILKGILEISLTDIAGNYKKYTFKI